MRWYQYIGSGITLVRPWELLEEEKAMEKYERLIFEIIDFQENDVIITSTQDVQTDEEE